MSTTIFLFCYPKSYIDDEQLFYNSYVNDYAYKQSITVLCTQNMIVSSRGLSFKGQRVIRVVFDVICYVATLYHRLSEKGITRIFCCQYTSGDKQYAKYTAGKKYT